MAATSSTAKTLRKTMTDAERLIWAKLRNRRLSGFKFRRQVPIGPFVVDFICMEEKLIIELDVSQHADQREADQRRTGMFEKLGYRVIRFSNPDVLKQMDAVLRTIYGALSEPDGHGVSAIY